MGLLAAGSGLYLAASPAAAAPTGTFVPMDAANEPSGVAQGVRPGRVAWAFDPDATSWNGTGPWWQNTHNDQGLIDAMLADAIRLVADEATSGAAWSAIFRHHNVVRGRGQNDYATGEKIAIKVNLNNRYTGSQIDTSPHVVHALLNELVHKVGVAQSDITVFDAQRTGDAIWALRDYCRNTFPDVRYNEVGEWVPDRIQYGKDLGSDARRLPRVLVNATYLIDVPVLKRHCRPSVDFKDSDGQTGVTLGGKSHCGTVGSCGALHYDLRDWNQPGPSYNPLVDIWASPEVGGKLLISIMDALYGGDQYNAVPKRWKLAPFNDDWPSSLLVSMDKVALDSVGLDFLRAEMDLTARADNYLHEAAVAHQAPSGHVYASASLGVHEHWNDAVNKQYSRNLGTGDGIELLRVGDVEPGGGGGSGGSGGVGGAAGGEAGAAGGTGGGSAGGGAGGGAGGTSTSPSGGTGGSGATGGTSAAGGTPTHPATGGSAADPGADQSGCSCSVPGQPKRGGMMLLLAIGAILLIRRDRSRIG
jgi:MYXO-CTERM domain-containing protein